MEEISKEDEMRVHYVWADMNNPVTRNMKRGISPPDYTLIMLIVVNVFQMTELNSESYSSMFKFSLFLYIPFFCTTEIWF